MHGHKRIEMPINDRIPRKERCLDFEKITRIKKTPGRVSIRPHAGGAFHGSLSAENREA
jgi:hypothetical protein